jgi:hypothetical protein
MHANHEAQSMNRPDFLYLISYSFNLLKNKTGKKFSRHMCLRIKEIRKLMFKTEALFTDNKKKLQENQETII